MGCSFKPEICSYLATASPTVAALQQATRTVPVVFVNVIDPVGAGFVESLARCESWSVASMPRQRRYDSEMPWLTIC
jgi:hypothetical protein